MLRKFARRHASLLAAYGAAGATLAGAELGGPFLFAGVALGVLFALKGAGLSRGRPFLALAPGAFALLGAVLLSHDPVLSGLAAAMALGTALESAPLLSQERKEVLQAEGEPAKR